MTSKKPFLFIYGPGLYKSSKLIFTMLTSAKSIVIQEDALKKVYVKKGTLKDADTGIEETVGEMKPVFIYTMLRTSIEKVMTRKVNWKRFA